MKNLIKTTTTANHNQRIEFAKEVNKQKDVNVMLDKWYFNHLIPKGNAKIRLASLKDLKAYVIDRYNKEKEAQLVKEIAKIQTIEKSGEFDKAIINVEYKRSRMWGYNPTADAKIMKPDGTASNFTSGSIGGCGYDKESTAVANALNQCNEILKALYVKKARNMKKSNRDLFGYGSGSGLLPHLEGGVGVSCYPRIFEKIGYTFNTLSSGKSFTVYVIEKKK